MEAWDAATQGDYSVAWDRARQAAAFDHDPQVRSLAAWLALLHGEWEEAVELWNGQPDVDALAIVRRYNEALEEAKRGETSRAYNLLQGIRIPVLPVLELRAATAVELDEYEAARVDRELIARGFTGTIGDQGRSGSTLPDSQAVRPVSRSRIATYATAGLALIIASFGLGRLSNRPSSPMPGVENDAEEIPAVSEVVDLDRVGVLRAFVTADAAGLVRIVGLDSLSADPLPPAMIVPEQQRLSIARGWYLGAVLGDPTIPSVPQLHASLSAVGASSRAYWVDDALYLYQQAVGATNPALAVHTARLLLEHHPQSIYNNSVTQSLAGH